MIKIINKVIITYKPFSEIFHLFLYIIEASFYLLACIEDTINLEILFCLIYSNSFRMDVSESTI